MTERIAARLVGRGAFMLVLGAVAGLLGGLRVGVAPSLIVTTHVTMIIAGTAFICFGLMWSELALEDGLQSIAASALAVAAYGTFVTGVVATFAGVGATLRVFEGQPMMEPSVFSPLLPAAAANMPSSGAEPIVFAGVGVVVASALVGLALVAWGVLNGGRTFASKAEVMGDRLRRLGVAFFSVGILAIFVTGLTPIPGLPVATHATIAIFGILFMALGLAWPRLRLSDELHGQAVGLLVAGAGATLLPGLLAPLLHLGSDTVSVSPAGLIGSRGGELLVKLIALVGALCMVGASFIVWTGLEATGGAERNAEADAGDGEDAAALTTRWIRVGALLLFLGSMAAVMTSLTRSPRLAVGTYGTMPIAAALLLCLGMTAPSLRLTARKRMATFWFTAAGAWGVLVVGMLVALLGIGGETLQISGRGFVGDPAQELLARIFMDLSVLALGVGIIMSWVGLRVPHRPRTIGAHTLRLASIIVLVLVFEAAFWHITARARFGEAYPVQLPDLSYGYGDLEYDSTEWLWDSDGGRADGTPTAQNWTRDDWNWFAHATQGGAFEVPIPYDWLLALEQPVVPVWPRMSVGRLMDTDYLADFGFLPSDPTGYDPDSLSIAPIDHPLALHSPLYRDPGEGGEGLLNDNPDGLPVGFARTNDWLDQQTDERFDAIGFTCAACHTGQVDYIDADNRLRRLRIEGGPANVDLGKFRTAVGISLALTKMLPGRFDRFAQTLQRDSTRDDKERLRDELDFLINRTVELRDRQEGIYPTLEGFARLDAIGRIANHVFGNDLGIQSNVQVANAPVNFPHIWDVSWFDWVQYNASFKQPMMRNAGESMGVFASLDLEGSGDSVDVADDPLLFSSSIDIINLHEMEALVAGERPFSGLESPEWPDVFPKIDEGLRDEGKALYERYCDRCHFPSPDPGDPENHGAFLDPANWIADEYLKISTYNFAEIGTDPLDAINFANRQVDLGTLGTRLGVGRRVPYGVALPLLIRLTKERRYCDYGIRPPEASPLKVSCPEPNPDPTIERMLATRASLARDSLDGFRPDSINGPYGYRARPLNGIWATPPFLHNGSVPNLYQLLSPQKDRPTRFWLGSKLFDPDSVGFYFGPTPGGFEFDTSLPGNSNEGHLLEGVATDWVTLESVREPVATRWTVPPGKMGVIGPELTHDQRMALIEYLKWLPPLPARP